MSKKIAFDLDGVFITDCDRIPNLGGPDQFYELTMFMRPLFQPKGEWSIITGRPARYKSQTVAWVEKYFSNMPVDIFHGATTQSPAEYKAAVINAHGFEVYVESDPTIVAQMKSMVRPGVTVYHFDEYVASGLAWDSRR